VFPAKIDSNDETQVLVKFRIFIYYGDSTQGYGYTQEYEAYIDVTTKLNEIIMQTTQFTTLLREMSKLSVYSSLYSTAETNNLTFESFTSFAPPPPIKSSFEDAADLDASYFIPLFIFVPLILAYVCCKFGVCSCMCRFCATVEVHWTPSSPFQIRRMKPLGLDDPIVFPYETSSTPKIGVMNEKIGSYH
jgi:hypothetical protein